MATDKNLAISGVLYDERRKFDLDRATIAQLYSELNPFLAWMENLEVKKVSDPDFKMFQDKAVWRNKFFLAAATQAFSSSGDPGGTATFAADGAVNCAIDSSLLGMQVEIWDTTDTTYRGNAIVTVVSGANVTLKVLGNPSASNQRITTVTDNDILRIVAPAAGEGTTSPEVNHDELGIAWNSTSITRVPLQITGTLLETALFAGPKGTDELRRLREVKMKEFKLAKERKLLMSYRVGGITDGASGTAGDSDSFAAGHVTDADGNIIRTTMGFLPIMARYGRTSGDQQNVFTFTKSTMKYSNLVEAMEKISQYGGGVVRDAFCGPSALTYWASLVNAEKSGFSIQISDLKRDEKYGFMYRYLETGHRTLRRIPMPLFHTHPVYKNWMLLPNADNVQHAVFRQDQYRTNIKTDNGFDGQKDEFFSDDGLCLTQVDSNALIKLQ